MDAGATGLGSVAAPRNQPLSIRTTRAPDTEADDASTVEPVSPTGRLMDSFYIVVTIGLGTPVNLPTFRAGIEAQLARHPRFRSIQVTDGSKDGKPLWVPATAVNLDDHVVVPGLDPAAVAADPDRTVEDYVASLSTLPMDRSRPLWDFHFLDFPTSEAAATVAVRAHHSLGDGVALMTLLVACTRSAADPARLPAMPPPPARSGPIYAGPPRPPASAGAVAFAVWLWSYVVLAWHTVADVVAFAATVLFVSDPHTLFKLTSDNEGTVRGKRFVHATLSLDDVKLVKNAMKCTVNDVLIGVTSAALSQYYFRESGDTDARKVICLRSVLLVNLRPPASLQRVVESGKSKAVKWGNKLGFIILPFRIAMHDDDPLEYVRTAKKSVDRKKSSLEALFTHAIGQMVLKCCGVKAAAAIFGRMISHTTISISNMVGPVEQVELFGHPIAFIAPSAYGPPEALTVHYQSYSNTIKVVLAVDEGHFACYRRLRWLPQTHHGCSY